MRFALFVVNNKIKRSDRMNPIGFIGFILLMYSDGIHPSMILPQDKLISRQNHIPFYHPTLCLLSLYLQVAGNPGGTTTHISRQPLSLCRPPY